MKTSKIFRKLTRTKNIKRKGVTKTLFIVFAAIAVLITLIAVFK